MTNEIDNVVFDLGGVLVDMDMARVREAFREIGMPRMADLMDPCYPAEVNERMERGDLDFHEACEEMRRIDGRPEVTDAQIHWVYDEFLARIDPEKLRQIDRLRAAGIRTYVLSNTNPAAIEIICDRIAALGKPMEAYFDGIFLSYRMRKLKPSPAIFEQLVAESGIVPARTLFIDDGRRNIETAASLGFRTCCPETNARFDETIEALLR